MDQTTQGTRLVNAKEFGQQLRLSKRQVFRLNVSGKLPKPLKIGRAVRWDVRIIEDWISLGCPDRKTFEAIKSHKIRLVREIWIWLLLFLTRLFFLIIHWPGDTHPNIS